MPIILVVPNILKIVRKKFTIHKAMSSVVLKVLINGDFHHPLVCVTLSIATSARGAVASNREELSFFL